MFPPLAVFRSVSLFLFFLPLAMSGLNFLRLTVPGSRAEPLEFLWVIVPGAIGLVAGAGLLSSWLTERVIRNGAALRGGSQPQEITAQILARLQAAMQTAPSPRPVTQPTPPPEPQIIRFPAASPASNPTAILSHPPSPSLPQPPASSSPPLLDPKHSAVEAVQWAMRTGRLKLAQMILEEEARKVGAEPGAADLDEEEGTETGSDSDSEDGGKGGGK